jgi:hypothetical protein
MKFKILIIGIIFNVFLSNSFSQEINGEFKTTDQISEAVEGDVFEGVLRFWPIENADLKQFNSLEKSTLFNAYYLTKILELGTSSNNSDVVELKGLFIVKSFKVEAEQVVKYNLNIIRVSRPTLMVKELKNKNKVYNILNQSSVDSNPFLFLIFTLFILALLIVTIVKRKKGENFFFSFRNNAKNTERKLIKHYDEVFRTANKREDFEKIYQDRINWLPLLKVRTGSHDDFFKTLNLIQFKKDWDNENFIEVRSAFDLIRRSFEE